MNNNRKRQKNSEQNTELYHFKCLKTPQKTKRILKIFYKKRKKKQKTTNNQKNDNFFLMKNKINEYSCNNDW